MNYSEKKIELVAPAGSIDSLNAAISEGADAVYLGLKDFNARLRAKNFSYKELEASVDALHILNKKVYIALNIVIEEWELNRVYNLLKYLSSIRVDAVIIQDLGLIKLINDYFPDLKIHSSTQMNIANSRGVNFLSKFNVKRVILSRELSFPEISNIISNTTSEIEIFVHGALCISSSGLCLFSSYFGGKSANKGQCTQACRRIYLNEDGNKKYYFSPKDLMLLKYIPDLINAGVNSLKIEGRMKNSQFVGTVVSAYRYMIDNYQNDFESTLAYSQKLLSDELSREKTTFFFNDKYNKSFIDINQSGELGAKIGVIEKVFQKDNGFDIIFKSNVSLEDGDFIRIHNKFLDKSNNYRLSSLQMEGEDYKINITDKYNKSDEIFLSKKSATIKKYRNLIPNNLSKYRKHPGVTDIPDRKKIKFLNKAKIPNGIYIEINNFSHFFLLQSVKPRIIIFNLNKNNSIEFKSNLHKIPYKREDIMVKLQPFFREDDEQFFGDSIDFLIKSGIKIFILNNISQLSYFKSNNDLVLIAGEYLYTFNSFSVEYLASNSFSFFIPPLEISKRNLLDMSLKLDSNRFIINIFAFPSLFNINYQLDQTPNILSDIRENSFFVIKEKEQTRVISQTPFSILDKIPYLNKRGFNKILINLSDIVISKGDYKNLVKKIFSGGNVDKFSRFNWKDGFFRPEVVKKEQ